MMNSMNTKTIGILGGMGPQASAYLYKTMIDFSVKYFGAKNNDEYPDIVLCSIPLPDFISDTKQKDKALAILKDKTQKLVYMDVAKVGIACNTAHLLLPDLVKSSRVSFVSMIEAVAEEIKVTKVGLLGTPVTLQSGLYEGALKRKGVEVVLPDKEEQKVLERIIRNVLQGKTLLEDQNKLLKIASRLKQKGAEGIVLGCTELPLVFPDKCSLPIYNSVQILALALLRNYYN